jgi:hypothetical protein
MIGILCTHWEEGLRSDQGLCPFPMSYRRVIHLPGLYDYSCSYGYPYYNRYNCYMPAY